MRRIRILVSLSIDGFCIPSKLLSQYNFDSLKYEDFYSNADIILTNIGGLKKLRVIELKLGKPVYKIKKDMSLAPAFNTIEKKTLSIEELRNGNKGIMLLIVDSRNLINTLFQKGWIDEMNICFFPVLLSKGKRLLSSLPNYSEWNVKGRLLYDSGITAIHYYK